MTARVLVTLAVFAAVFVVLLVTTSLTAALGAIGGAAIVLGAGALIERRKREED